MTSIDIPIKDRKNPPVPAFAKRCVNCGKPGETSLGMTLQMGAQKRGQPVVMKLDVPMCNVCAGKERGFAKVTLIPFLIAGLVSGLLVFVPVAFIAPQGTSNQTLALPLVIGAAAGLVAALIGGSMVEFLVKMLAVPFYGKSLARRPLTIIGLFTEGDELIGLSVKFAREASTLHLTFENEDVAREFKKLNPLEKS